MKTWIKILVPVFLALATGQAAAADLKIGVVDTERLLRESAPAVLAEKRLEKEFAGRNEEIGKLVEQVKGLQAKLDKDGASLSETARRAKERELDDLTANLQRMQREFRENLNMRKNEELINVLGLANQAIQKIAETGKYDLILQEAVYRNPKLDITDMVMKYLDTGK
ncbi:MAG: OmpH family outer membrane protein [Gallionellaceae bacterium]|jgi:outer membrane protein|nr:OmpH family outer membrane protein [Gallionellaceae bacterium]